MKYTFRNIGLSVLTILSIGACSKSTMEDEIIPEKETFEYTFKLAEEPETKATLEDARVMWSSGDKVGILSSSFVGEGSVNTESDPMTVTVTSGTPINVGEYLYAYYPYNEANTTASSAVITLPKVQYGENTSSMPLVGIPFAVPYDATDAAINYLNIGSVIKFNIYSSVSSYCDESVKSVALKVNTPISGEGTIDLTKVSKSDVSSLVLDGLSETSVKVYQNVIPGTGKTDGGIIKMVVAPGTYSGQIIITTDAATYTFNVTDKTFNRSAMKTFNVDLKNGVRVELSVPVKNLPYAEAFTSSKGDFSISDVTVSGVTTVWTQSSSYGMKASAYANSTSNAAESWLISPIINLVDKSSAKMTFNHTYRYTSTPKEDLTLWVRMEDDEWQQVTIPTYPSGTSWTFVESGDINLSAFVGHQIQVAFKYMSDEEEACTWEIKNVTFEGVTKVDESENPVVPDDPGADTPSTDETKSANGKGWLEMPAGSNDYSNVFLGTLWGSSADRNYSYFYDKNTYTSYWVAYPLYSATTGGSRSGSWKANPYIDEADQVNIWDSSYRVNYGSTSSSNYSSSKELYARGHQIPDADRSGNSSMQTQTYYATNSTPQIQNKFNGSVWMYLEAGVRDLIPSSDTLYVVTGATLQTVGGTETLTYIYPYSDSGKATPVPNYYWKVLLKVKRSGKTVTSASAIGFWLNHVTTYSNNDWQNCTMSVDEIEQKTGFNFFVNLPDSIETAAESNSNLTTFSNF